MKSDCLLREGRASLTHTTSDYFHASVSGSDSNTATPKADTNHASVGRDTNFTNKRDQVPNGDSGQLQKVSTDTRDPVLHDDSQEPEGHIKLNGETSFGMNLTTGKKEYLSQYPYLHDSSGERFPGDALDSRQEDTVSTGSETSESSGTGRISDSDATGEAQGTDMDIY